VLAFRFIIGHWQSANPFFSLTKNGLPLRIECTFAREAGNHN
jgi:hypothetical protein